MKDELGDRMKKFYESRTRTFLPRKSYTIIRIDGKAFHTYTRAFKKPFDDDLMNMMDETAKHLCKNIQGAKVAFVQSDEISILVTDFETYLTDAWYDGNVQKIVSVSASIATAKFNQLRWANFVNNKYNQTTDKIDWTWFMDLAKLPLAEFDSRTFTIPNPVEVENYFIWRQNDTVRNSVSMLARKLYSPQQLMGKNNSQLREMCLEKGTNWDELEGKYKNGRMILKQYYDLDSDYKTFDSQDPLLVSVTTRTGWVTVQPPIFTQEREFITGLIPSY